MSTAIAEPLGSAGIGLAGSSASVPALPASARAGTADDAPGGASIGVEFSVAEEVLCVRVAGEIDVRSAPAFALALDDVLSNAHGAAVVDLTGIRFLGTIGLGALVDFHRQAKVWGVDWALAGSRAVLRPLRAMGIDLPACDTAEAALVRVRVSWAPAAGTDQRDTLGGSGLLRSTSWLPAQVSGDCCSNR